MPVAKLMPFPRLLVTFDPQNLSSPKVSVSVLSALLCDHCALNLVVDSEHIQPVIGIRYMEKVLCLWVNFGANSG